MDDLQSARKYLKKSKSFMGRFFKYEYIDVAIRYYTTSVIQLKTDKNYKQSIIGCIELINCIISLPVPKNNNSYKNVLDEYAFLYETILEMIAKMYLELDDNENSMKYYSILISHLEYTNPSPQK